MRAGIRAKPVSGARGRGSSHQASGRLHTSLCKRTLSAVLLVVRKPDTCGRGVGPPHIPFGGFEMFSKGWDTLWFCPFKEKTSHKESGNVCTPRRASGHLQPCCEWSGNQTRAVGGRDHRTPPFQGGDREGIALPSRASPFEGKSGRDGEPPPRGAPWETANAWRSAKSSPATLTYGVV